MAPGLRATKSLAFPSSLFPPCTPGWCEISDGTKYGASVCHWIFLSNLIFQFLQSGLEIFGSRVEILRREIFFFFFATYRYRYRCDVRREMNWLLSFIIKSGYKSIVQFFERYTFFKNIIRIFLWNFIFDRFKASNCTQQWSQSLSKIPHAITRRYLRERLSTKYFKGNHSTVMPVRQVETGVNIFIDRCPFPQMEAGTRNRVSPIYVSQLTKIS